MKGTRLITFTAVLAGLSLNADLAAQSQYVMDLDGPTSNFQFDGDSSVGRIVGTPPRFDMDGTMDMLLTPGAGPFATGEVNGGVMYTVPWRIEAKIPNVFSWLPPLATIDIDNAAYSSSTPQFAVDAAGNFATDIVLTPVGGTVTVYPLVGSTETTPLTDYDPTDPTPISGTITEAGGTVTLHSPVDVTVASDDGAGNWTELHLFGELNASAATQADMTLSAGPVAAGSNATFDVAFGQAAKPTFLAYGLNLGSTPVPPLGITLDIAGATQVGAAKVTDGAGSCSWTEPVPPGTTGLTVYMQSCQNGMTSNVLTIQIQ